MAKVIIHENENFEKALRYFRKRCAIEGIFKSCRDRRYYVKPSKKKRERQKNKK